MRYSWIGVVPIALLAHASAYAQSSFNGLTYVIPGGGSPVPAVNPTADGVSVLSGVLTGQGYLGAALPLSDFASQKDLISTNQNLNTTNQNLAALGQSVSQLNQSLNAALLQNSATVGSLQQSVNRTASRASQGIAAVSSLNVIPPNPGDRFSVTFGGGGYDGQAGGGISFAYRPPEAQNITVFAGYARALDTNLFKGGISFSFR